MRTKKRRKSLDERLLEARASAGTGRTDARRFSALPESVEETTEAPEEHADAALVFAELVEMPPVAEPSEPTALAPEPAYEAPAPIVDEPAPEAPAPEAPAPEAPAPEADTDTLSFETAEQGVDEIARAVAALSTAEGDTFLPGRASGRTSPTPKPVVPSARPAIVEPEHLFARPDTDNRTVDTSSTNTSTADTSNPVVEARAVTRDASLPSMSEPAHAPEPVEPTEPTGGGSSELPTGLMDRWMSPSRRARKAMAHAAPAAEPDQHPPVAENEQEHTATVATLPRDEMVDSIAPFAPVVRVVPVAPPEPEVEPQPVAVAAEVVAEREPEAAPANATASEAAPPDARGGHVGRVGSTLIERGLVSDEQLTRALEIQRGSGRRVGEILVELGALTSVDLARVLAEHFGVTFTDLRAEPPDPILARFLPEEVARRYDALAVARRNDVLVIAMANPTDLFALDDLQLVARQPVIATMAVKEDLQAAIERVYRGSIVETTLDAATSDYKAADAEIASAQAIEVNEGPIVGLVSALLTQAITDRASDLHVEPCSTHVAVRFRVDGVLHDSSDVPLELLRPLVSRLKILAGLDIAQNRVAQDGRFSLTIRGRSVDVRVVTMPTAAGESVILRLLDPVRDSLGVASLGLRPAELDRFIPAFQGSQGAVFIVGPTGSGKTSTVYAVLSEINTRTKSIISVEDPVEFRLDGVKQIQMNPRVGLTFATTLPSVLRADPDVVFIGEVRDSETARIAADASITGHLVLSTIHATRAAATPMRLIEMGVEPYLVASALTLVASQRLARKLCEHCSEAADASAIDHLRGLGADEAMLDDAKIRRAVGCPACRNSGYRSRLPIFEIMPITESISRLILDRAPRLEIERVAVGEGMDTLDRAALRRVVQGELSIEEMLRVIS